MCSVLPNKDPPRGERGGCVLRGSPSRHQPGGPGKSSGSGDRGVWESEGPPWTGRARRGGGAGQGGRRGLMGPLGPQEPGRALHLGKCIWLQKVGGCRGMRARTHEGQAPCWLLSRGREESREGGTPKGQCRGRGVPVLPRWRWAGERWPAWMDRGVRTSALSP